MYNLNITKYGVKKLNFNELMLIGEGCSFAYDVGFFLRLAVTPDHLKGFEIALYDLNCNQQ